MWVRREQLLDVVRGRISAEPMAWLAKQGQAFRARIEFGTLDISGTYRRVFEVMTPTATLVADPFHVTKLANTKLWASAADASRTRRSGIEERSPTPSTVVDACSPESRNDWTRRAARSSWGYIVLVTPAEMSPPCGEAKEAVRELYAHADPALALDWVTQLRHDIQDTDYPIEARSLGRTLVR